MDNLEYLEKVKKGDKELNNEINRIGNNNYPLNIGVERKLRLTFRKMKALKIIAEQIIKLDDTLGCVVTTLENIETAIRQR